MSRLSSCCLLTYSNRKVESAGVRLEGYCFPSYLSCWDWVDGLLHLGTEASVGQRVGGGILHFLNDSIPAGHLVYWHMCRTWAKLSVSTGNGLCHQLAIPKQVPEA